MCRAGGPRCKGSGRGRTAPARPRVALSRELTTLAAAPTGLGRRPTGLTRAQCYALRDYQSSYYYAINGGLRHNDLSPIAARRVATIDEAMKSSRLTSDVAVWRGASDARKLFGGRLNGDLTGTEWSESAYESTSADRRIAEDFTYPGVGPAPVLMRVRAPRGVGAIQVSGTELGGQAELVLERGLRHRVVRDHGVSPQGYRLIDVEVLPA